MENNYCINCESLKEYTKLTKFITKIFGDEVCWKGEDFGRNKPNFKDVDFPMFIYLIDSKLSWSIGKLYKEEIPEYTVPRFINLINSQI